MTMFKKATKLEAPKSSGKKKEKEQIQVKGLMHLSVLDALIKQATAMRDTIKNDVMGVGFDLYMKQIGGTRPSSYEGVDGKATASIEIRKRSSVSTLTVEEVEVLQSAGLKVETRVKTPHLFAINPAYASDEALLAKVEKAIEKFVPERFIFEQEAVEVQIVNDGMLDTAYSKKMDREILSILTTLAVKPKLNDSYNMNNLLTDAMEIMNPAPVSAKVTSLKKVK